MLAPVSIVDVNDLMNLQFAGRKKQCGPEGLPYRTSKDDVCRFTFSAGKKLMQLDEDFQAETDTIELMDLATAAPPGQSMIGVFRS